MGAPHRPLRLLVTAFGPFPGVPLNPSEAAARRMLGLRRPALAGVEITFRVLPTRWDALEGLADLVARGGYDGVLMLGVAARRRQVTLERRAVNGARSAPDAAGRHPAGRRLAPAGPEALFTTVPTAALAAALRRGAVPAAASRDAGRYLCNAGYFRAIAAARAGAAGRRAPPVLFVHLPGRSGRPRGVSRAAFARALSGLLVAFAALARGQSR